MYYKVGKLQSADLGQQIKVMQQTLATTTGVCTLLKRRPETDAGLQTWMEIYLAVPDDFEATLDRAVSAAGLSALIEGSRHLERFMDID